MSSSLISNQIEYERAVSELEALLLLDPEVNSFEGRRINLLSLLIENYEKSRYNVGLPRPVDAIKFRMEQEGLSASDLVPYLGSRSKVSEVLSERRPLSLSMIKALHKGLGIPAEVLLQDEPTDEPEVDLERFPINEIIRRGWVSGEAKPNKKFFRKYLSQLFAPSGGLENVFALYKVSERSGRPMDRYSLALWTARIVFVASENKPTSPYVPGTVDLDFMRRVVQLSTNAYGPLEAQKYLRNAGISLVVEKALPQTYLDGAAIMIFADHPIIGLSLRYDRIDNFWFTLMHELAHVALHFGEGVGQQFYDDLDLKLSSDPREMEADALASNSLIPESEWLKSAAQFLKTKEAAQSLARKLEIHPAIVAGRMRREHNSYYLFNDLVGHGQVKSLFLEDDSEEGDGGKS